MTTYAVEYRYTADATLRDELRPRHRAYLGTLAEGGALLGSGPYLDGAAGALLVLRAGSRPALDDLLAGDPFAAAGLIASTSVREWSVVIGPWAVGA